MTSYSLYNSIAINLADVHVSRFSNLLLISNVLTKSFPKMYYLSIEPKVMTSYVFSIVITFQIWAYHVTCLQIVQKLFIIRYAINFRVSGNKNRVSNLRHIGPGSVLEKKLTGGLGLFFWV